MYGPWIDAFFILAGQQSTCADVLFSGHTCNMTLCGMVWHKYSHIVPLTGCDPLKICLAWISGAPVDEIESSHVGGGLQRCTTTKLFIWVWIGIGYLIIIATRFHYSVDVFIGLLLSVFLFKYYHIYIQSSHMRNNWWNKMLCWLEKDSFDVHSMYPESFQTIQETISTI